MTAIIGFTCFDSVLMMADTSNRPQAANHLVKSFTTSHRPPVTSSPAELAMRI